MNASPIIDMDVIPQAPSKRMNIVTKPIGASCNIDCTYCYYLSKSELLEYQPGCTPTMDEDSLERYIQQYIDGQNHSEIVFNWQGGEPTMLGITYFEKVVEFQKKYAPSNVTILNNLQTNGILLNKQWCQFFKYHQFHIGISIDGPELYHNTYRQTKRGKGTFKQVMRAIELLKSFNVTFSTLTCVNNVSSRDPLEVYRFLRDVVEAEQMQFIPIVELRKEISESPKHWKSDFLEQGTERLNPDSPDSVMLPWSVTAQAWGDFLIAVFDEWKIKDAGKVSIQYFESLMKTWAGDSSPICTLGELCGKGMAIEPNGDVYSCDHYVFPEYKLGNMHKTSLERMAFSMKQQSFGLDKSKSLTKQCDSCDYKFACYGECPKNRFIKTKSGEPGLNYLCAGWKKFFEHADYSVAFVLNRLGYEVINGKYAHRKVNQYRAIIKTKY